MKKHLTLKLNLLKIIVTVLQEAKECTGGSTIVYFINVDSPETF